MNEESAVWYNVVNGVPQGSMLTPLLLSFMSMIFLTILSVSTSQMFADDLKIHCTMHDLSDSLMLQSDINNLADWSKDWLLANIKYWLNASWTICI